jgi:hypothetical protein
METLIAFAYFLAAIAGFAASLALLFFLIVKVPFINRFFKMIGDCMPDKDR